MLVKSGEVIAGRLASSDAHVACQSGQYPQERRRQPGGTRLWRVNCPLDPTTDDKSWRTSSDIFSRPLLLANLGKSAHSRWCRLQAYPAIDFAREEPGPMDQRVASLLHLADVHVRRRPRCQILGVVIGGGVDPEEIRAKV